jgi:hypothetical protein
MASRKYMAQFFQVLDNGAEFELPLGVIRYERHTVDQAWDDARRIAKERGHDGVRLYADHAGSSYRGKFIRDQVL